MNAGLALAMNHGSARRHVEELCNTTAGNFGLSARCLADVELQLPSVEVQRRVLVAVTELRARMNAIGSFKSETMKAIPEIRGRAIRAAFA
jgi:hypothetical protein